MFSYPHRNLVLSYLYTPFDHRLIHPISLASTLQSFSLLTASVPLVQSSISDVCVRFEPRQPFLQISSSVYDGGRISNNALYGIKSVQPPQDGEGVGQHTRCRRARVMATVCRNISGRHRRETREIHVPFILLFSFKNPTSLCGCSLRKLSSPTLEQWMVKTYSIVTSDHTDHDSFLLSSLHAIHSSDLQGSTVNWS